MEPVRFHDELGHLHGAPGLPPAIRRPGARRVLKVHHGHSCGGTAGELLLEDDAVRRTQVLVLVPHFVLDEHGQEEVLDEENHRQVDEEVLELGDEEGHEPRLGHFFPLSDSKEEDVEREEDEDAAHDQEAQEFFPQRHGLARGVVELEGIHEIDAPGHVGQPVQAVLLPHESVSILVTQGVVCQSIPVPLPSFLVDGGDRVQEGLGFVQLHLHAASDLVPGS
mmetsp:Transcript_25167/g.73537  ORF Transcript_25167/g.73537 Transcript_25167/m.73537 type:complete len:223 (+) Transcript_25167:569-1237(+)